MRNALLRSAICARRFLHRCVLSSAFVSGCPGLPWPRPGPPCLCTQSSACRLYSKRRQSSNAATTSSAHFHDQCLALPIRFQSQPDCPTAPMPLLYPRLRCALTELHCASSLRRGDPLPIHAPSLLSKVRAIARIWISRVNGNITSSFLDSIGNKGARPCLAPWHPPSPTSTAPRPPSPPRLPGPNANANPSPNPNQARAVGLPPDALKAAAAQLEWSEAVVAEAERGGAPRGPTPTPSQP